jgi:hypothetical protein
MRYKKHQTKERQKNIFLTLKYNYFLLLCICNKIINFDFMIQSIHRT